MIRDSNINLMYAFLNVAPSFVCEVTSHPHYYLGRALQGEQTGRKSSISISAFALMQNIHHSKSLE